MTPQIELTSTSSVWQTMLLGAAKMPFTICVRAYRQLFLAELMRRLLDIEKRCDRLRGVHGWIEPLIDILLYGDLVLESTLIQVPHPRMLERAFDDATCKRDCRDMDTSYNCKNRSHSRNRF